jgi:hypothetical protein
MNTLGKTIGVFFGGMILGLAVSKYSHRAAYELGLNAGLNMTQKHTNDVCTAWWFNNGGQRLADAKKYICRGSK